MVPCSVRLLAASLQPHAGFMVDGGRNREDQEEEEEGEGEGEAEEERGGGGGTETVLSNELTVRRKEYVGSEERKEGNVQKQFK